MRSKTFWVLALITRLGLLAIFITTVVIQAQFMPHPVGTCDNPSSWPEDSPVPPDTPTIWELLPAHNKTVGYEGTRTKVVSSCETFINSWRYAIAVV